jgi:hypothetical protein
VRPRSSLSGGSDARLTNLFAVELVRHLLHRTEGNRRFGLSCSCFQPVYPSSRKQLEPRTRRYTVPVYALLQPQCSAELLPSPG